MHSNWRRSAVSRRPGSCGRDRCSARLNSCLAPNPSKIRFAPGQAGAAAHRSGPSRQNPFGLYGGRRVAPGGQERSSRTPGGYSVDNRARRTQLPPNRSISRRIFRLTCPSVGWQIDRIDPITVSLDGLPCGKTLSLLRRMLSRFPDAWFGRFAGRANRRNILPPG
jgi:hypothetical protein